MKIPRIQVFKNMPLPDKLFTILLVLTGMTFFANGLYQVGPNGLFVLAGAIVFHIVMEICRSTEIAMITKGIEQSKSALNSQAPAVGAAANTNNGLIPGIIEKKKKNPQQSLLNDLINNSATNEPDEEQARADHEFLVEMARKKQEAMRTAVSGPPVDPSIQKKIIEKQEAYIKELMKPTIIPQRELAEKAAKKKG